MAFNLPWWGCTNPPKLQGSLASPFNYAPVLPSLGTFSGPIGAGLFTLTHRGQRWLSRARL